MKCCNNKKAIDNLIGDIIQIHPDAVEILFNFGLSCVGCPASQMETLEEATIRFYVKMLKRSVVEIYRSSF